MKKSKKGISLIVLIITIIVIIILATAILVSVINNNPISEANKARYESDRDNMQAVFTNTVGKIMAENQGVVNVTAGQINTEATGVNETTGEVTYTVDNAENEVNASGTIIFDKGTNDATTYYTGKKLPIYAAGETKWYVDSDGVISLKVASVKYGDGKIVLSAGLYDEDENQLKTWQELLDEGVVVVENGVLRGGNTTKYGLDYEYTGDRGILVIDSSVTSIKKRAFGEYAATNAPSPNLIGVVIPDTVTRIESEAFAECPNLKLVEFGEGLTFIGSDAFEECRNLISITLPDSLITVEMGAFRYCEKLTYINPLPNCTYGNWPFTGTAIEEFVISDGMTAISVQLLEGAKSCKTITIPKSVTEFKSSSFARNSVKEINYGGTKVEWEAISKYTSSRASYWNNGCGEITVHCTDGDIIVPACSYYSSIF